MVAYERYDKNLNVRKSVPRFFFEFVQKLSKSDKRSDVNPIEH